MDAEEKVRRAASFGSVAGVYADKRPGYPDEAVSWLIGNRPLRILELGAGTGKLTGALCALGHNVVATDPSAQMLDHLSKAAPSAQRMLARAEDIPLAPSSVDVVVAAQAFHWFDAERVLPEVARVLRPGGGLCLLWNTGDGKVPWVRKVFALTGAHLQRDLQDPFEDYELFTLAEQRTFRHWQVVRKPDVVGLVASQSNVAALNPGERAAILDEAAALYDSYGRGPDGMQMPWLTHCYRGRVAGHAAAGTAAASPPRPDFDDGLLIDFT